MEPAERHIEENPVPPPAYESPLAAPGQAAGEIASASAPFSLDRFSPDAKKALEAATEQARCLGHAEIRPEHLLLAFLFDPGATLIRNLFRSAGVGAAEFGQLHDAILERLRSADLATDAPLRLSDGCKQVLQTAIVEAAGRARPLAPAPNQVEPAHLLIGLIAEGSAFLGSQITARLAIRGMRVAFGAGRPGRLSPWPTRPSLPLVQRGIEVATGGPSSVPTMTRANVVTFRITDSELVAVDTLVESGAMRSRSEASGWLLHAGIVANQDFFDQIRSLSDEIARLRQEVQRLADQHIGRRGSGVDDAVVAPAQVPSPTTRTVEAG